MSIVTEATSNIIMAMWFLLDDFCFIDLFVWVLVEFFEIGCFIVAFVVGVGTIVEVLNWISGSKVWTIVSHCCTSKQLYFQTSLWKK